MGIKKHILQDLPIDPAVETALRQADDPIYGKMRRVRRARNLTPGQRRKALRDEQRTRVMIDADPDVVEILDRLAEINLTSRSQVINYMLHTGLNAMESRLLTSAWLPNRPSRSMRFEHMLEVPEVSEKLAKWAKIRET